MTSPSIKSFFGAYDDDITALEDIFNVLYNLARPQMPYDMLSITDQKSLAFMFLERHTTDIYLKVLLYQDYTLQITFPDFDPETLPSTYGDKQLAILYLKKYLVCMKKIVGNTVFLQPTHHQYKFYIQASYFLQNLNEWINQTDPESEFYLTSRYAAKHIARLKADYKVDVFELAASLAQHSALTVINNFIALNIKLRRDFVRCCSIPRFLENRTERKFESDLNIEIDNYQHLYDTTVVGKLALGNDGWFKKPLMNSMGIVLTLGTGYACYRYYIKHT